MNTQKEVFNKLFKEDKVELSAQKIELGLSDDLQKIINKSDKITSVVNDYSNDLSKLFREVKNLSDNFDKINDKRNSEIKNGKSTYKEINDIIDKVQTQAKELGIQPKNVPNFSKTLKSSSDLRSAVNDFQKYSDFNL